MRITSWIDKPAISIDNYNLGKVMNILSNDVEIKGNDINSIFVPIDVIEEIPDEDKIRVKTPIDQINSIKNMQNFDAQMLRQLEHKIDLNNNFDKSELQDIDIIRRKYLDDKVKYKNPQILEKCLNLLLDNFDKRLINLRDDLKNKTIDEKEYNQKRRNLLHLRYRLKQDDPRKLDELEEESKQVVNKVEELSDKILPSFI